ncbi:MAG TPA: gamma-glutamyltransferase, partial [Chitinophagaceae bacterium]|nr:gamma-glutamyltransferase [Chitinophagaceae bacterium]
MKKKFFPALMTLLLIVNCTPAKKNVGAAIEIDPYHYRIQKKVVASHAAVVSAHPLASRAGLSILRSGGNAFDAAIATQLALAVVYPNAGNLGGGGFTIASLSNGKLLALDYRETAPVMAHRDMYVDPDGTARTDKSQEGHLASGVPGSVAGIIAAHQYAKLPFDTLIQPAIDLAEKGFVITAREARALNNLQDDLKKFNSIYPVFVKQNGWKEGDTLIQTDLSNTLKRIQKSGAAGFYEGETARLIVEEMKRGGGIISLEDLKNYGVKSREPHVFDYKGYRVVGMPMPSSGGLLLHQMMKMIENRNIAAMGFHSPEAVQMMTEVERRAFADRGEYMGDADFYKVPLSILTSEKYLQDRM